MDDLLLLVILLVLGLVLIVFWFLFWKIIFTKLGHTSPTFEAVMMCIPIVNMIVLFAVALELLYLLLTELNKRLKERRKKIKKEKIKSHEERYVAHHISFYSDGRLIGKEIIHDKANAKLKRRIRMLVKIKAPGYKICSHSEAPRKNSVSYTIRQEEIK